MNNDKYDFSPVRELKGFEGSEGSAVPQELSGFVGHMLTDKEAMPPVRTGILAGHALEDKGHLPQCEIKF